jgi:hypothetical protein
LGATRRCLLDGHFYCSGEIDRPNLKKKKKGQSCSSEFDYIGWKATEQWKREMRKSDWFLIAREPEGCENCEFPSQCRYVNHRVLGKDRRDSSEMTASDLGTPSSMALLESPANGLSRFYKHENTTVESTLAGYGGGEGRSTRAKVTDDYYRPDRKSQSSAGTSLSAAMLREIMRSATRRSGGQATLSSIREESTEDSDVQETEDDTDYLIFLGMED